MFVLLSLQKPLVSEWDVGPHPVPVSHASHTLQQYQVAIQLPIAFAHGQGLFTISVNGLCMVDVSNTGYHILCGILCHIVVWRSANLWLIHCLEKKICLFKQFLL